MLRPQFITFTGADDRTDPARMDAIARRWTDTDGTCLVEWGVLFSPSNRDARYPCAQAVSEFVEVAGRKSAHLCGGHAKTAAALRPDPEIPLSRFDRVQLNGKRVIRDQLHRFAAEQSVEVILQAKGTEAFPDDQRALFLYDASGGNGVFPETVPPRPGHFVGYAGGMGPDTVEAYLGLIERAGGDSPFWIDMEGRLRDDGWLNLDRVERVLELVYG